MKSGRRIGEKCSADAALVASPRWRSRERSPRRRTFRSPTASSSCAPTSSCTASSLSSDTVEGADGWPETVTSIQPLRVWKGALAGQTSCSARRAGCYTTAGSSRCGAGPSTRRATRSSSSRSRCPTATSRRPRCCSASSRSRRTPAAGSSPCRTLTIEDPEASRSFARRRRRACRASRIRSRRPEGPAWRAPRPAGDADADFDPAPRALASFLDFLDSGASAPIARAENSVGEPDAGRPQRAPQGDGAPLGNINDTVLRYTNGATEAWSLRRHGEHDGRRRPRRPTGALATLDQRSQLEHQLHRERQRERATIHLNARPRRAAAGAPASPRAAASSAAAARTASAARTAGAAKLHDDQRRRGLAALLCDDERVRLDDDPVGPDARARPHARPRAFGPERLVRTTPAAATRAPRSCAPSPRTGRRSAPTTRTRSAGSTATA